MPWWNPWTAVTGTVVTAAQLNETRDNLSELRAGGLAISGQATNRVPYASSSTQLATDSNLTFDGTTLTTGNVIATGTLRVDNNVTLGDATSDVITVNGYVNSAAGQPGFLAYNSSNDTATSGTVEFDVEVYDTAGNYNATTDTFTAPVPGQYLFCVVVTALPASDNSVLRVKIVTTGRTYEMGTSRSNTGGDHSVSGCVIAPMAASDTAIVTFAISGGEIMGHASEPRTHFSGRLMP